MILLLGASGYVGSAFSELLTRQGVPFHKASRSTIDYTNNNSLRRLINDIQPTFLINAAGYTGKPNVDACEIHKTDCLLGNSILPGIVRKACEEFGLPWGHVSSGCIFNGTRQDGGGFTEKDEPNFCFRSNHCSFYSGCKALGEEVLVDASQVYIWRLRIPFNHIDSPRNYLSKLQNYQILLEATNSISHLDDFVWACWQSWERKIPFGIYNVTNPGAVTTKQVTDLIRKELRPKRNFEFFTSEEEFMTKAAKTPRSNCVLDTSKLTNANICLRTAEEAILSSLRSWKVFQ
jgi:dTDP-4-dehydrorhamnose reductase